MPFQIIRNDITKVKADAIVNTANPKPRIGRGTDSTIYAAAGEEQLMAARKKIGDIEPGQAVHTDAFSLDAKCIIHTVGPAWIDGDHAERDILRSCYEQSLALAYQLKGKSIAFPLIATGTYGFPKDEALHIALSEIQRFLLTHEMKVTIVVFDRKALELSEGLVGGIEQFIDDHTAQTLHAKERGGNRSRISRRRKVALDEEPMMFGSISGMSAPIAHEDAIADDEDLELALAPTAALPDLAGKSLAEILDDAGDSFQQRLLKLIDESGMDDVTVYKKANIDPRCSPVSAASQTISQKKKTALAFAIALELDMPTMTDLLSRAEIALSPSSTFDLIITYFVTNKNYDIFEINAALFKYGQPILGE